MMPLFPRLLSGRSSPSGDPVVVRCPPPTLPPRVGNLNQVHAHLLAGASLKTAAQDSAIRQGNVEGKGAVEDAGPDANTGDEGVGAERTGVRSSRRSTRSTTTSSASSTRAAPACSGQAYSVADGQPCNPQAFLDGILDSLGAVAA